MSTQHTPGPWIWGPNAQLHADTSLPECLRVLNVGAGKTTALCWDEHDARLIAAAPALLAALQGLVGEADLGEIDHDDDTRELIERARAAIELATGAPI